MSKAKDGSTPRPEKVTKLEGAERLLKTAIRLFFEDGDMLPVHALVAGAHEVLRTLLAKKNRKVSFIKDSDLVRPEFIKIWHQKMNRTQNFLKHADSDADKTLDFYPPATTFWIIDSISMHTQLTGALKHQMFFIFFSWFAHEHPDVLRPGALADLVHILGSPFSKKDFRDLIDHPEILGSRDEFKHLI